MDYADIGICKYVVRTETFDQAMQSALRRGLKIYEWDWLPGEPDQETWYINENAVKRENQANYLRGAGRLNDEHGHG